MIECHLCRKQFHNNKGGQLTNHLRDQHSLSLADHFVATELSGIEPKCACGCCDERPAFVRGAFLTYAPFHNSHKVRAQLFFQKFGCPKCRACDHEVGFTRGLPKPFCSQKCALKGKSFDDPFVQQKITAIIRERYGVDNIFQRKDIVEKIKLRNKNRTYEPFSVAHKKKIGEGTKQRWSDPSYRLRTSLAIKVATNSESEKLRRSEKMSKQMQDPEFQALVWNSHKNRLTKLHQRIRKELNLEMLGFVSEQRVGCYWVDELCIERKIIVEINGDYSHANPKLFHSDALIRFPGQSFLAREKWEQDKRRTNNLIRKGYQVLIIWESDDLVDIASRLNEIIDKR